VATSEQREVTDDLTVTARVDAVDAVELRPRVSGHITEVRFVAGQLVHQNDVLFVIDRRWYKAEYDRTTAEVARAVAALGNAQRISRRATNCRNHRLRRSRAAIGLDEAGVREVCRGGARYQGLDYDEAKCGPDHWRSALLEGNYASGVAGANAGHHSRRHPVCVCYPSMKAPICSSLFQAGATPWTKAASCQSRCN
jgi:hypothetical protein